MKLKWGTVLGSEAFTEGLRKKVCTNRETSGRRKLRQYRTREEIVRIVEQLKDEKWAAFCNRHGDRGRDLALWAARRRGGMTLREAGVQVNAMDYTAACMAVRQLEKQSAQDAELRSAMCRVQAKCE
ncbi:MAG: hypothetical protein PHW60_02910 [Kiritimatiellae bacterium]|nr:hypothetical protein [Kiritimatiellia bacterium]